MSQLDWLDTGGPRFPRARRSDPKSSHDAAARIERRGAGNSHADRILAALKQHPGSTCREIAQLTGIEYPAVSKRLRELVTLNRMTCAEPTENTKPCSVIGERVCRWYPAAP